MSLAVVILAAGEGTRMKSKHNKIMQEVAGRPMLEHLLRAVEPLNVQKTILVVGFGENEIRKYFKGSKKVAFVTQDFEKGYGTGAAFMQAAPELKGFDGDVLVLFGDGPLLKSETLLGLAEAQKSNDGMSMLTSYFDNPTGYGRVIRDNNGAVAKIVEEKDASETERAITEINPGIHLFDKNVFEIGKKLTKNNAAGEYYLTDFIGLYTSLGKTVKAVVADSEEVLAANDRKQLFGLDKILRDRIRDKWMAAGVTMLNPEQTYIDDTVVLERDVVLEPGVFLRGNTIVKEDSRIGAYSHLTDCIVKEGAKLKPFTIASNKTFSYTKPN